MPATPRGVAAALEALGDYETAALAERAFGFRLRPREDGGHHLVTVDDCTSLTAEEVSKVDGALFGRLSFRTAITQSPGLTAVAAQLSTQPQEPKDPGAPANIGVITSGGGAMRSDIRSHLEVFQVTSTIVFMRQADTADQLVRVLRDFSALPRGLDAVLMARDGADPADLHRLGTDGMRHEVDQLRQRGTFVVAAFGHGNTHVDVHADVHAHTPTSGAEVLRILDGAPPRSRAALALGVTDLRIGEVMTVSADRLDLEQRLLVIDRQLQRVRRAPGAWENVFSLPKGEKKRTITLPRAVVLELRRHLRDHRDGGLLFRGSRGAEMRRTYRYDSAWRLALRAAGLPEDRFVFHSLRLFAASSMLAEGAPIAAVAGHLATPSRPSSGCTPTGYAMTGRCRPRCSIGCWRRCRKR